MLREIFGPKRDEVAEVLRRLHNLKVCDSSPNIMQVVKARRKMGGAHEMFWRQERFWWGREEGRRPLGKHSSRWDDNIKMDLKDR